MARSEIRPHAALCSGLRPKRHLPLSSEGNTAAHGRGVVRGSGARTQHGAGGALTCACTARNCQPVSTSAMPAQPVGASTAANVTTLPRSWRGRTLDFQQCVAPARDDEAKTADESGAATARQAPEDGSATVETPTLLAGRRSSCGPPQSCSRWSARRGRLPSCASPATLIRQSGGPSPLCLYSLALCLAHDAVARAVVPAGGRREWPHWKRVDTLRQRLSIPLDSAGALLHRRYTSPGSFPSRPSREGEPRCPSTTPVGQPGP
jgi:hypothetical protein